MRLLDEDEPQRDFVWYAAASKYEGKLEISFEMFDPVEWERYTADYFEVYDKLRFDDDSKSKLSTIRQMIAFIDSDELKSIEFKEDGDYDENNFVFEI